MKGGVSKHAPEIDQHEISSNAENLSLAGASRRPVRLAGPTNSVPTLGDFPSSGRPHIALGMNLRVFVTKRAFPKSEVNVCGYCLLMTGSAY